MFQEAGLINGEEAERIFQIFARAANTIKYASMEGRSLVLLFAINIVSADVTVRLIELAQLVFNINARKQYQHHIYLARKMKDVISSLSNVFAELVDRMDPKDGEFTNEAGIDTIRAMRATVGGMF
jgi:hypothetical protein